MNGNTNVEDEIIACFPCIIIPSLRCRFVDANREKKLAVVVEIERTDSLAMYAFYHRQRFKLLCIPYVDDRVGADLTRCNDIFLAFVHCQTDNVIGVVHKKRL